MNVDEIQLVESWGSRNRKEQQLPRIKKSKTQKTSSKEWFSNYSMKLKTVSELEGIRDIPSIELIRRSHSRLTRIYDEMIKELSLSLIEKAAPIEEAVIEYERSRNEIFLETIKDKLREKYLGKYVVISNAQIQAHGKTYNEVKDKGLDANHRFIFRVKKEDPEPETLLW